MTDFIVSHPWSCTMAYLIACFIVWSWLSVASDADDEMEKMGRIYRVK